MRACVCIGIGVCACACVSVGVCSEVAAKVTSSCTMPRASVYCRYGVVVLDEAHIRSLDTDVLIGLARQLLDRRDRDAPKLVIMSATLNAGRFADFFGGKVFRIPGRMCVQAGRLCRALEQPYHSIGTISLASCYRTRSNLWPVCSELLESEVQSISADVT